MLLLWGHSYWNTVTCLSRCLRQYMCDCAKQCYSWLFSFFLDISEHRHTSPWRCTKGPEQIRQLLTWKFTKEWPIIRYSSILEGLTGMASLTCPLDSLSAMKFHCSSSKTFMIIRGWYHKLSQLNTRENFYLIFCHAFINTFLYSPFLALTCSISRNNSNNTGCLPACVVSLSAKAALPDTPVVW